MKESQNQNENGDPGSPKFYDTGLNEALLCKTLGTLAGYPACACTHILCCAQAFQATGYAAIALGLLEKNTILLLSPYFKLTDELGSRKFGRVVLEITHVKFSLAKIPMENMGVAYGKIYIANEAPPTARLLTGFLR